MRATLRAVVEFFGLEPGQRETRIGSHPASSLPRREGRFSGQGERATVVSADSTPKVGTKLRTGLRVCCKLPPVAESRAANCPTTRHQLRLLADDAHVGQEELRNYLRGEIAPREAMSVELDD